MPTQVDGTKFDQLRRQVPAVVFDAAMDYVMAGRVAGLTKLGPRLGGRVRGHNGTYRVAVNLADQPVFACDCGRAQPCRHAAALAIAWTREPAAFTDLLPLLESWRGEAAESALLHVVDRCFGPFARDSADALLELTSGAADADPLRLETYLEAVSGLAVADRMRLPALAAELRERALALAQRQGRTAAVRALTALVVMGGRLLARPGSADESALLDEVRAAVRNLDSLLARGGLDAGALADSLMSLADTLAVLPSELLAPVMNAGSRVSVRAATFLAHRLRAAAELAKAELALTPGDVTIAERVRELVMTLAQFLLSHGRDDEALALARAEARGPAGALPLIDTLSGSGQRGEAIAVARDALGRAAGGDVAVIRRRLAGLLEQDGKPELALAYLAANYNEHPDVAGFTELRELARACNGWDELRSGALTRLLAAGSAHAFAEAVAGEARALEGSAPAMAKDVLTGALLGLPAVPAGETADEWRHGIELLLREARRLYRRLGDETGWRALREDCRRRYGIQ